MSQKGLYILTVMLCSLMLAACGLSEENLSKLTKSRDALLVQKELAENLNGNLVSDTFEDDILQLSSQSEEFSALNFEKLKNKEVEDLVSRMDSLTDSYQELTDKISEELKAEENAVKESEKHIEILCKIENASGSELSSICFKDNSANTVTANYLANDTTLPSGRILAGVTFPVYLDSNNFCLVVTDTLENEYEYTVNFPDLSEASGKEFTLKLGTPEEGATIN